MSAQKLKNVRDVENVISAQGVKGPESVQLIKNFKMFSLNTSASYLDARQIAKSNNAQLASLSNTIAFLSSPSLSPYYSVFGNSNEYFVRELYVSEKFTKGKGVKDEFTKYQLRSEDIKKAHENSKNGIYDRADKTCVVLLVDAKDFSERKGFNVIEEPIIKVIETSVPEYQATRKYNVLHSSAKIPAKELVSLPNNETAQDFSVSYGISHIVCSYDAKSPEAHIHFFRSSVDPFSILLEVPAYEKVIFLQQLRKIICDASFFGVPKSDIRAALKAGLKHADTMQ